MSKELALLYASIALKPRRECLGGKLLPLHPQDLINAEVFRSIAAEASEQGGY